MNEYGGCTYINSSQVADTVMISLTSVAVFLLLVIVFLLVKLMRANKDKCSNAAAAGETGTTTEPLLGGTDA